MRTYALSSYQLFKKIVVDMAVKAIGQAARIDLVAFLERPVHLFLQVKVRPNWLDEPDRYSEMGLDFKDGD